MKFDIGQRVIYTSPSRNSFHAASMGQPDIVMHLNATDERGRVKPITGEIISIKKWNEPEAHYGFRPDGWQPFSENSPSGFVTPEKYLRELTDESLTLPGTLVRRDGKPMEE